MDTVVSSVEDMQKRMSKLKSDVKTQAIEKRIRSLKPKLEMEI